MNYLIDMKNQSLFSRRTPDISRCPSCSLPGTLHRSKGRSLSERIIKKITFFKIYRCSQCGWRGYLSTFKVAKISVRNISYYLVFAVVVAIVVREIIKRMVP